MLSARRFPPPWTLEELNDACFIVKDASGQGDRRSRQSPRKGMSVMSTGTEVSPNVGFQNSLIGRVWHRAVISRRHDRIGPLRVDGRGVLAPTVA
jgi:hypothetical protein